MAKQIKLNYKGKDYVLEYNRKAASQIEKAGFNVSEVETKIATNVPLLFQGAFIMHHRGVNPERIEEIFNSLGNREKLVPTLVEMVIETYNTLLEDNENDNNGEEKNVDWEIV